jgi:hypothetical protein
MVNKIQLVTTTLNKSPTTITSEKLNDNSKTDNQVEEKPSVNSTSLSLNGKLNGSSLPFMFLF